jgi:hypothetical protein
LLKFPPGRNILEGKEQLGMTFQAPCIQTLPDMAQVTKLPNRDKYILTKKGMDNSNTHQESESK